MFQIRMDRVPQYVQFCREVANRAREEHALALQNADAAQDPEMRRSYQETARAALDVATSNDADADELTQKFVEAGGKIIPIK